MVSTNNQIQSLNPSASQQQTTDSEKLTIPPGGLFLNPPHSDSGELLLRSSPDQASGVWIKNSPLLRAQEAVLRHMKDFLSDWKLWRPETTLDRDGFSFNSLLYRGDRGPLRDIMAPFVTGQPYAPEGEEHTVLIRINNFPAGSIDQAYHNHRAPFASFIFNPNLPDGTPIYKLMWGVGKAEEAAQVDVLCTGTSYAIENYANVYHRVTALEEVYTVIIGVIPKVTRDSQNKHSLMMDLGKNARFFNAALEYFDREGTIKRVPDIDEFRRRRELNREAPPPIPKFIDTREAIDEISSHDSFEPSSDDL